MKSGCGSELLYMPFINTSLLPNQIGTVSGDKLIKVFTYFKTFGPPFVCTYYLSK